MQTNDRLKRISLVMSLVLHGMLLFLWKVEANKTHPGPPGPKEEKPLRVTLAGNPINPDILEQLKKNQVVNNEDTGEEKRPDKTRFLGKKDQTYPEETVAKKIAPFSQGGEKGQDGEYEKETPEREKESKKSPLKLADLANAKPVDSEIFKKKNKMVSRSDDGEEEASSSDYIDDVKPGEHTHLNTKEFKFWSFYDRIRQRLEPIWEGLLSDRLRNGRKVILEDQVMTLIRITLDEEGNLSRIKVLTSSGDEEVDDIAIDAITLSGPFQGVPREMIKNEVAELDWGFLIKP